MSQGQTNEPDLSGPQVRTIRGVVQRFAALGRVGAALASSVGGYLRSLYQRLFAPSGVPYPTVSRAGQLFSDEHTLARSLNSQLVGGSFDTANVSSDPYVLPGYHALVTFYMSRGPGQPVDEVRVVSSEAGPHTAAQLLAEAQRVADEIARRYEVPPIVLDYQDLTLVSYRANYAGIPPY